MVRAADKGWKILSFRLISHKREKKWFQTCIVLVVLIYSDSYSENADLKYSAKPFLALNTT